MISSVTRYYQRLLADRVWYAEGLSWTVVQQLTVDEVCRRLAARRVDLDEVQTGRLEGFDPLLVAGLTEIGSNVIMVQQYGFEGSRPEVLHQLSGGTRVLNASWTITGNGDVSYAMNGKVLTRIDKNFPEVRSGEEPSALDEYAADLSAAQRIWNSEEGPASTNVREAAAMAVVENATGVRLTAELLDEIHGRQTVMLGRNHPRTLR